MVTVADAFIFYDIHRKDAVSLSLNVVAAGAGMTAVKERKKLSLYLS